MVSKRPKKKWTWKGRILYILFLLVFVLASGEIIVRIMGAKPWSPEFHSVEVKPGGSFFEPHSLLGYKGRPGSFELFLNDQLNVKVTHNDQGYRITSHRNFSDSLPEVWIFGCSFTHGYGVEDDENYPWMLQERFPHYRFRNFGMDGYGTCHSFLQLESLSKKEIRPLLIILAYGGFHNQRNVNNRIWRKALSGREIAEGITYPYMRFDEAEKLVYGKDSISYSPWAFMKYSALIHYLEKASNRAEDEKLRPFEVTRRIIQKMNTISDNLGSQLVVANIFRHADSQQMLDSIKRDVPVVDISIDMEDLSLRILPEDGHPNAKGHKIMAKELGDFLEINNLLQSGVNVDTLKAPAL